MNSRKLFSIARKATKQHFYGFRVGFRKLPCVKQVIRQVPHSNGLYNYNLVKRVFNYFCQPYVQGNPKCKNSGTLKIIALHPYPTSEENQFFFEGTHNIRYQIWPMATFLRVQLHFIFKSLKVVQLPKALCALL